MSERYRTLGMQVHRVEIEGDWPAAVIEVMRRAMTLVRRLIQNGHTVFLHCTAGMNRSPTVALMYLNMIEGMPVEEALATVQLSRPQAKPYEDVVVVLRALAARRGS
ncbi:MAG: protein-tyrosine phosphatase family protein [bacterium]